MNRVVNVELKDRYSEEILEELMQILSSGRGEAEAASVIVELVDSARLSVEVGVRLFRDAVRGCLV